MKQGVARAFFGAIWGNLEHRGVSGKPDDFEE